MTEDEHLEADVSEPLQEICSRMNIDYADVSEVVIRLKPKDRSEVRRSSNFADVSFGCGCNCASTR